MEKVDFFIKRKIKELEHSFLETLKESYNGDFTLYKFEDGAAAFISSTVSEEAIEFPFSDKLEQIVSQLSDITKLVEQIYEKIEPLIKRLSFAKPKISL